MIKENIFYWFRRKGQTEWQDTVIIRDGHLFFCLGRDMKLKHLDLDKWEFKEIKKPEESK